MAGVNRGKIECYHLPYLTPLAGQEAFTSIYKFFQVHPNMSEIARHGGLGGNASNVNYHDEANPFLPNAWFVFRMNTATENPAYTGTRTFPWYVLVQWTRFDSATFGSSPGNPGLSDGTSSGSGSSSIVSVQFAIGVGGDQNPWNGGGSLGTNTKGSPVWKTPTGGTTSYVFPRSNNVGGSHTTNKENGATVFRAFTGVASRSHVVCDDDSIVFLSTDDLTQHFMTFFGEFTPKPGSTQDYPYVMLGTGLSALPLARATTLGSTSGFAPNSAGVPVNGSVRSVILDRYTFALEATNCPSPNQVLGATTWDEFPLPVFAFEAPNNIGYVGQVDFVQEVSSIPHGALNGDGSKVVVGSSGTPILGSSRVTLPWGNVPFGSGYQRSGFVF